MMAMRGRHPLWLVTSCSSVWAECREVLPLYWQDLSRSVAREPIAPVSSAVVLNDPPCNTLQTSKDAENGLFWNALLV